MKLTSTQRLMATVALGIRPEQLECLLTLSTFPAGIKSSINSPIKFLTTLRQGCITIEAFVQNLEKMLSTRENFLDVHKEVRALQGECKETDLKPSSHYPIGLGQYKPSLDQCSQLNVTLLRISDQIPPSTLEVMVTVTPIPDAEKQNITQGYELFSKMKHHGCISENDVEFLEDMFQVLKLVKPQELLEVYKKHFPQISYPPFTPQQRVPAPVQATPYSSLPSQPSHGNIHGRGAGFQSLQETGSPNQTLLPRNPPNSMSSSRPSSISSSRPNSMSSSCPNSMSSSRPSSLSSLSSGGPNSMLSGYSSSGRFNSLASGGSSLGSNFPPIAEQTEDSSNGEYRTALNVPGGSLTSEPARAQTVIPFQKSLSFSSIPSFIPHDDTYPGGRNPIPLPLNATANGSIHPSPHEEGGRMSVQEAVNVPQIVESNPEPSAPPHGGTMFSPPPPPEVQRHPDTTSEHSTTSSIASYQHRGDLFPSAVERQHTGTIEHSSTPSLPSYQSRGDAMIPSSVERQHTGTVEHSSTPSLPSYQSRGDAMIPSSVEKQHTGTVELSSTPSYQNRGDATIPSAVEAVKQSHQNSPIGREAQRIQNGQIRRHPVPQASSSYQKVTPVYENIPPPHEISPVLNRTQAHKLAGHSPGDEFQSINHQVTTISSPNDPTTTPTRGIPPTNKPSPAYANPPTAQCKTVMNKKEISKHMKVHETHESINLPIINSSSQSPNLSEEEKEEDDDEDVQLGQRIQSNDRLYPSLSSLESSGSDENLQVRKRGRGDESGEEEEAQKKRQKINPNKTTGNSKSKSYARKIFNWLWPKEEANAETNTEGSTRSDTEESDNDFHSCDEREN